MQRSSSPQPTIRSSMRASSRMLEPRTRSSAMQLHPDRGDFTMAATQRIGELTISVDSGGSSPAFSRRVVRELAERLGAPYADAVRTLARMRTYVKETFPEQERAPILRALAQRPIGELAAVPRDGRLRDAAQRPRDDCRAAPWRHVWPNEGSRRRCSA